MTTTTFVDELKARHVEAHKRLQAAQLEMQAAQGKLNAIAQEFNSLQFLLNSENAKLAPQDNATEPAAQRTPVPAQPADLNKTDMIRELLKQHPTGMTPSEIWKEVKGQLAHRAYLYSILKRLKDRDEVFMRRKKYIPKMVQKPEEGSHQIVVQ
jgi:hypothetical protein